MSTQAHWDAVYDAKPSTELGWYEPAAAGLQLVLEHAQPGEGVIDVGGGDSRLVAALLERGYRDLSALDLSDVALDRARARLGHDAERVEWIHADVTRWSPHRRWDLWHDRAVFHFLTSPEARAAYKARALRALASDGRLIVAAFSTTGPDRCAGLAVERYDSQSLPAVFAPEFRVLTVEPVTPADTSIGDQRPYVVAVMERAATPLPEPTSGGGPERD